MFNYCDWLPGPHFTPPLGPSGKVGGSAVFAVGELGRWARPGGPELEGGRAQASRPEGGDHLGTAMTLHSKRGDRLATARNTQPIAMIILTLF